MYLPADKSKENDSFIFFAHGGGFTGGDKSLTEAVHCSEYPASKGYVAASANYRLAAEDNNVSIHDMYEDLMTAVDVSARKADELGYYLNELAIQIEIWGNEMNKLFKDIRHSDIEAGQQYQKMVAL